MYDKKLISKLLKATKILSFALCLGSLSRPAQASYIWTPTSDCNLLGGIRRCNCSHKSVGNDLRLPDFGGPFPLKCIPVNQPFDFPTVSSFPSNPF